MSEVAAVLEWLTFTGWLYVTAEQEVVTTLPKVK